MTESIFKSVRRALSEVWPLYGAAFAMATALSVLWTAIPFVLRNIGATEEHVGYALAANMFGYLLCLLLTAAKLGHLNPRRTTRAAAAAMFAAIVMMLVAVYYAVATNLLGSHGLIWTVIAAGTVAGGAMSLYWPYLMAWVSADYEGAALNRRLGTYNGMWSSAAILGPAIGGAIVDVSTSGPIAVSAASLATCFALLYLAHDGSAGTAASLGSIDATQIDYDRRLLLCLKWMARISLFCSWLWFSVARTQFALRFTEMGFSETLFGVLLTTFGICNFLTLTGAGRVGFWHFKPALLFCVQPALAISALLLVYGRTFWVFALSFVIIGCAFGFSFSSHMYYGVCGSKKRPRQMAIHEVTISLGVIVGSASGGYLAGRYGGCEPYWFAVIALGLGLVAQAAIWIVLRKS
ncbi:MAG: MFS transporter [Planctomycetota bacterium]|jgi:MFS family permease